MPFTPLHMGPGMLIKALLQGAFSMMIFGWCQVLMDIQPLVVMITGAGHLHGFSHTFVGSTGVAIIAAVSGKPGLEWLLSTRIAGNRQEDIRFFGLNRKLGWVVTFVSALIGSYSHVALDAVMHSDVQPWFPLSVENPFLYVLRVDVLQVFCLITGVIGLLLYFTLGEIKRRS